MKNDNNTNKTEQNTTIKAYFERNRDKAESGGIISVMFSGVGGQGIILASTVLAAASLAQGYDVKVSEVHGMAQRGGSVVGSVRFGKKVYSPIIGKADVLMAMERLESVRYLDMLSPGGFLLINDHQIVPVSVYAGGRDYPGDITGSIREVTTGYRLVDATDIAAGLGEVKASNMVLMGSLSRLLPISVSSWKDAIKEIIPETVLVLNLDAFEQGREMIK